MNKKIIGIIALLVVVLGVFLFYINGNNDQKTKDEAVDIKQLVEDLSLRKVESPSASITSEQLIMVNEKEEEVIYELPEDEFFVSIAPFIETTHPCANHSLTGCQGELVNQTFEVLIEDEDGNVLVDETMTTMENGFIDLWLPRNKIFNVTITQDGKMAEQEISTFKGDNTCITTMQLVEKENV